MYISIVNATQTTTVTVRIMWNDREKNFKYWLNVSEQTDGLPETYGFEFKGFCGGFNLACMIIKPHMDPIVTMTGLL